MTKDDGKRNEEEEEQEEGKEVREETKEATAKMIKGFWLVLSTHSFSSFFLFFSSPSLLISLHHLRFYFSVLLIRLKFI